MAKKKTKLKCPKHKGRCYAVWLNEAAKDGPVFSMEVCKVCDAHLAPSGICLNACHLSARSRERFSELLGKAGEKRRSV